MTNELDHAAVVPLDEQLCSQAANGPVERSFNLLSLSNFHSFDHHQDIFHPCASGLLSTPVVNWAGNIGVAAHDHQDCIKDHRKHIKTRDQQNNNSLLWIRSSTYTRPCHGGSILLVEEDVELHADTLVDAELLLQHTI